MRRGIMIKKLLFAFVLVLVFSMVTPSVANASGSYLRLGDNWSAVTAKLK